MKKKRAMDSSLRNSTVRIQAGEEVEVSTKESETRG